MLEASWQGVVIAKTAKFEQIEGNYYFPADTLHMQYFRPSEKHTQCSWKGEASYYNVVVGEQTNQLNRMKMQEAQRGMDETNAMRRLDPTSPTYLADVTRISPEKGFAFAKHSFPQYLAVFR